MNRNKHSGNKHSTRQGGVGLIEVLVSILIFAFGILGLVGLQTRTLSYSQESLFRSQAAALTEDILDRMRADRTNAKAGQWDSAFNNHHNHFKGTTLAQMDLKEWKLQVETLLPSGEAAIARNANRVIVTIRWNERGDVRGTSALLETKMFETTSSL